MITREVVKRWGSLIPMGPVENEAVQTTKSIASIGDITHQKCEADIRWYN